MQLAPLRVGVKLLIPLDPERATSNKCEAERVGRVVQKTCNLQVAG